MEQINRRSFLESAAVAGGGVLPVRNRIGTKPEQILEVVATDEAELYYEFAVKGEVEGAETSDKIGPPGGNDAIATVNDLDMQVVRGFTGNPGYGDAYAIDGDIIFYAKTGGTSDFFVRLDDSEVPVSELNTGPDPTTPSPKRDIGRQIDGTLEVVTTEEALLYYEMMIGGDVSKTEVSEEVAANDKNDAIVSGIDPETMVVRGFTGNPGYGDAYAVDGELVSFRRTGGESDFFSRIDGEQYSLEELASARPESQSPECMLKHFQAHHLREEPIVFQNRQERFIEKANRAKIIQQLSELNSAAIEALQAIAELRFGDYSGATKESIEFYHQLTENTHTLAEEADQEFFQLLPPYGDRASSIYSLVNGPTESVSGYADTIQEAVQVHREQDTDSLMAALRIAANRKLRDDVVGLAVEIGEVPLDDAVGGLKINALGQLALRIQIKSQLPILEELERLARKRDNETITEKEMYGYLIYKQEYWSSWTRFAKHTYNLARVGRNNSRLFQAAGWFNDLFGTSQLEGSKEGMRTGRDQFIAATRRLSMLREGAQNC